jgi:ribonuclease HII
LRRCAAREFGGGSVWFNVAKRERIPPLPPWEGRHFVGIDENGMGPRLGPLVVTSVVTETTPDGAKLIASRPRGAIAKRIGDSKKLVAFDDSWLGEAWARAIVARAGITATTPTELLRMIALDSDEALRAPCPSHHTDMCWADEGERFHAGDELVASCAKDLDRLEQKGVRVVRTFVGIVCTKKLNEAVGKGLSRFDVDLHTMERLTLAAREETGHDVYALCGKVGGFDFYGDRFGPLAGRLYATIYEGRARSEYTMPGVGRLAFVRDGDDTHLVIALASLVGKWARDHLMRRIVRWHQGFAPGLPEASGYHDPVTTKFVKASALVRKKQKVQSACFERLALGRVAATSSEPRKKKPTASPEPPSQSLLPLA